MGKRARQQTRARREAALGARVGVPAGSPGGTTPAPVEDVVALVGVVNPTPDRLPDLGWRQALRDLQTRRARIAIAEEAVVAQALQAGVPIAEVARVMGISRPWASQRFGHLRSTDLDG